MQLFLVSVSLRTAATQVEKAGTRTKKRKKENEERKYCLILYTRRCGKQEIVKRIKKNNEKEKGRKKERKDRWKKERTKERMKEGQ